MRLTKEQFAELVKQLEGKSRSNPKGYRLKVLGMVGVGFSYMIGILLLLAALVVVLVMSTLTHPVLLLKLGLPIGGLIWVMLRSLRIKFDEPEGIVLTPRSAPELYREIESLGKSLQTIRIHKVLLTSEFNAAVVQIPRLGLLGWHRSYLMLGLPLMQALSPDEFRAVLAHEMAHLSRSHSKFHGWIYRVRRIWGQLIEKLEEKDSGWIVLFKRFLDWYGPKLNAYTFVLARENEYEADRLAAEAAGSRSMADALVKLRVQHAQLDRKFWPEVDKLAQAQQAPPPVYSMMQQFFEQPPAYPNPDMERSLKDALRMETEFDDTHPSLHDRLDALGEPASIPALAAHSSAHALLGDAIGSLTRQLNESWQEQAGPAWLERMEYFRSIREEYASLEQEDRSELTEQQLWTLSKLAEELHGFAQALPLYEELLHRNDRLAHAYLAAGLAMLGQEDRTLEDSAVFYLTRAMELDEEYTVACCVELIGYYSKLDNETEAGKWKEFLGRYAELLRLARREREQVSPGDRFEPHGLEDYQVAALAKELRQYPILREACLVRKKVEHFPEKGKFVLLVRNKRKWRIRPSELARHVVRNLSQEEALPAGTTIIVLNTDRKYNKVREQAAGHRQGILFQSEPDSVRYHPAHVWKGIAAKFLMQAIGKKSFGSVRLWLALGADSNRLYGNMLPLALAAHGNDLAAMNALAEAGAPIDGANRDGNTPLFWAASEGNEEAVCWLLEKGADPNVRYVSGRSVLSPVCMYGHARILKLLLDAGAEPVHTCHSDGETPLMIASYNGRYDCVELLLAAGADPDVRDKHGNTALSFAKDHGHDDVAELLQAHAASGQPA